ncbi:hypothetical protein VPNG_07381 [Cytospora leucostoma]|uniref:DNA polymerase n=1 Tax=Cytospora leucostoma TaxID=1230097 RepID=A0A423WUA7_9PEZI|nr:hypothetical protein VPNG_07381 [Cytospora leucostoma]
MDAFPFKVRMNCIDFYQTAPTKYDPLLRNDVQPPQLSKEPKVPVIRVFGSTPTGQKVCAHIHGAFPYLYIEYTGSLAPEEVGAYIYRLHLSIDHALAVSYRQDAYSSHAKYVARITLTKGVPFYGFHVGYRFFLKIYMFNPIVMTRVADLLHQGVIMKRKFQPYEAHLQYLLQFMCDYNLYGCDYIESNKVMFRSPVPQYNEEDEDTLHVWHDQSISRERMTDDYSLPRSSHCSLEVDMCVQDILNRKAVKERRLHHDFVEKDHPVPASMKLVHSMAGLWADETKRRKRRMKITDPGSSPFPPEVLVSMSADPRESQPQGWIHEDEYMEQIKELISEEARTAGGSKPSFEDFVQLGPIEDTVNTTLEAVEDLYPHKLLPSLGVSSPLPDPGQLPSSSIEVDENRIFAAERDDEDLFPDDSDDDLFHEHSSATMVSERGVALEDENAKARTLLRKTTINNLTARMFSTKGNGLGQKESPVGVLNYGPPSAAEVCATMQDNGLPDVIYQDAFYSQEKDVPPRMKEYAGREFRLEGITLPFLPEFDATGQSPATFGQSVEANLESKKQTALQYQRKSRQCSLRSWEIADPPPTFKEVSDWWAAKQKTLLSQPSSSEQNGKSYQPVATQRPFISQVVGATPKNKHGFKYSQKKRTTSVQHEAQYMSTMSLEIHVNTRGKLCPNPEEDEIQCIFWATKSDENFHVTQSSNGTLLAIVLVTEDDAFAQRVRAQTNVEVIEESTELDAMVRMVEIVRNHDPDVLTGYEVHGSSWGYLIERARFKYDYNLCDEFSRMKTQSHGRFGKEADRWGFNTTSTIRVTGRHMINIWRAMRGELNLLQYTMENVVWHLLHRRIPHYSWRTLSDWYTNGRHRDLAKVLRYYTTRTKMDIQILEENELIPRTSEQARLLGVDFFSVFSRGSQYKVESIMFRIAKPENFVLVSPSRKQVGGQNALECLPLVMEPQSAFYNSPLLVLDFQSLYPSVMIAYNYCYSTFLGRIVNWRGTNKMGFTDYKRQERLLELLQNYINIAPNGMMYAKVEIRKSLLAKMLTEILETRVMVKSGMKQDRDDKTLQQLLNNRQLALKLLANVTYGYTSASFSGRMPCSEIADSIVQTGRETLERAIAYIHSVERWGAEVVYGDTDSLFIYLKGRTRDQAFDIGQEISKAITDMNPRPIKLKFEKVYHPCVLLAKKRYVGYKYESRDQVKPDFDAKGIETVRRDGTPAEQKMEEKALKLLFETADLSQVKSYFQSQCDKIMRGQVSIQDFCFAKEVRLGTYSGKGPPPPGALISTRRMLEDARAEPQYGERVPYVVITGGPGARLIDRCVAPEDLLDNDYCTLDAEYYITKNLIPPLERIFNLVGANVRQWYDEMPKVQRIRRVDVSAAAAAAGPLGAAAARKKFTLESYLRSASCVVCGAKMKVNNNSNSGNSDNIVLCGRCRRDAAGSLLQLQGRLNTEERRLVEVVKVCQSCAALSPLDEVPCDSKDCPVFYTRKKQEARLRSERGIIEPALKRLAGLGVGPAELEW